MTRLIEAVAGGALVLLVVSDLFRTILLPRPTHYAFRLMPLLGWAFVPLWLPLAACFRSADIRQTFRGSLGPFLLVLSLAIWIALLFLGFGLVLHSVGDEVRPPASFADSLYYAANAFLTLGLSPGEAFGSARLVTVASGMVGLAGVTILATYLVSLQTELNRREVLVLRTEVMAGRPPTGIALLESYSQVGMTDELAGLFRDWSEWAADVIHSHRANPILIQFRSADEDGEWLAVFGAVLDAATLALGLIHHASMPAGIASARVLAAVGTRAGADLVALCRLQPDGQTLSRDDVAEEVRRARERLTRLGFELVQTDAAAIEAVYELRGRYQPNLTALYRRLGIATARGPNPAESPPVLDVVSTTRQE